MSAMRRMLLISNSTQFGRGYLEHAETEIRNLLGDVKRVLFVPYALFDRGAYAEIARKKYVAMGYELESIHKVSDSQQAVQSAEAMFIGGGNTFRLLKALYDNNLLDAIRGRVRGGMPYVGASAGSIITCPTIRTTNDMPIVEPPSLRALGLIPFQLNCHYIDADANSKFMGETRELRLEQYHEENDTPVLGLREGGMLRVDGESILLMGAPSARIFRCGEKPFEVQPGTRVDELLVAGAAR